MMPNHGIALLQVALTLEMPDPKAHVRAAILTGAMTFDPAPLDLFEIRVPAIRFTLPELFRKGRT